MNDDLFKYIDYMNAEIDKAISYAYVEHNGQPSFFYGFFIIAVLFLIGTFALCYINL